MLQGILQGPIAAMLLTFPSSGSEAPSLGQGIGGKSFAPRKMGQSMTVLPSKNPSFQRSLSKQLISFTVGSKHKAGSASGPNVEQFFRLLLNPTATAPISSKVK